MFDFGNHLRMLREKHGISQEELGRRVGRAGSVISNYENNIKNPPRWMSSPLWQGFTMFR